MEPSTHVEELLAVVLEEGKDLRFVGERDHVGLDGDLLVDAVAEQCVLVAGARSAALDLQALARLDVTRVALFLEPVEERRERNVQGADQPLQGAERGRRVAVLDFREHARRQSGERGEFRNGHVELAPLDPDLAADRRLEVALPRP